MALDHSLTYKEFRLRNISHILRLKKLKRIVKSINSTFNSYADFGCSNGYLTNLFSEILGIKKVFGFDHSKNLEIAKVNYPFIIFERIDLNSPYEFQQNFEFISCFETLEHVGNIKNALELLRQASSQKSTILISVPIEIGFKGLIKYLLKRCLYKDNLPLLCTDFEYFKALLKNQNISKFRPVAKGYGSHFGFDYRDVDSNISYIFPDCNVKKWNNFTTRYYCISRK